jgi:hypothetical protein
VHRRRSRFDARGQETKTVEPRADIDTTADSNDRAIDDTSTAKPARIRRRPAALPRPSNDRFKRRARYSGTVVISITRSGRRPWPGQYALPYIR